MRTYLASLGLMVSCNVVYSLAQKFLPKDINPFMVLVVVYTIAGSISLGLAFSFRVVSLAEVSSTVGKLNWAVLAWAGNRRYRIWLFDGVSLGLENQCGGTGGQRHGEFVACATGFDALKRTDQSPKLDRYCTVPDWLGARTEPLKTTCKTPLKPDCHLTSHSAI
jgi:hypothetical protein